MYFSEFILSGGHMVNLHGPDRVSLCMVKNESITREIMKSGCSHFFLSPSIWKGMSFMPIVFLTFCFITFYLKRFRIAPSYHWSLFFLIQLKVTREPRIQKWVSRTVLMANQILTYLHIYNQCCCQLDERRITIHLKVASASNPKSPPTETKKGEKWRRWWRHDYRHFHLFYFSEKWRNFSGNPWR